MGGMTTDERADVYVIVPKCFNLELLRNQIGPEVISIKKLKVLTDSAARPKTTPIAFVYGRSAPLAYLFLIFPELVIYIQDRFALVSRMWVAGVRNFNIL